MTLAVSITLRIKTDIQSVRSVHILFTFCIKSVKMIKFVIKGMALLLLAASSDGQQTTKYGRIDPSSFDVQVLREIQLLITDLQKSKGKIQQRTFHSNWFRKLKNVF